MTRLPAQLGESGGALDMTVLAVEDASKGRLDWDYMRKVMNKD
jgi:hypothetical protein